MYGDISHERISPSEPNVLASNARILICNATWWLKLEGLNCWQYLYPGALPTPTEHLSTPGRFPKHCLVCVCVL